MKRRSSQFSRRLSISLLALAFLGIIAFMPTGPAQAQAVSTIRPIGGVAGTCVVNTGFSFPVSYVHTGTGSDTFQMTAPGFGQLNTVFTQEPTIGYPIGSGTGIYGTGALTYSLPAHTPITLSITTFSGNNYTGSSSTASLTYDCTSGATVAGAFFNPGDDRLNREPGVPAALYCRNQGDVYIWRVAADTSKGKLGLIVTKAEINAVINSNPAQNTLIKQSADGALRLYYLPATKELSFITPDLRPPYKSYAFVWKGCS